MQDQIAQMLFCVALGCALAAVAAAAVARPRPGGRWLAVLLPRAVIAAGPLYLGADYALYQGTPSALCAAASFALGLWWLRGWWAPAPIPRRADVPARRGEADAAAAPTAVFDLAGRRRAAAARAVLRERILNVVRDDRRPDNRSMPSAA